MNKPKTTAAAASRKPRKTLEAYLAAFAGRNGNKIKQLRALGIVAG